MSKQWLEIIIKWSNKRGTLYFCQNIAFNFQLSSYYSLVSAWEKLHNLWVNSKNRCRVPIITNHSTLFIFQTLAKLIFLINYLLPFLSFAFVFQIKNPVVLDICLGKGHSYFFQTQSDLCSYDSIYSKGACWTLLILYAIGSSNILDAYVIFCCAKEIKKSTEKQKQSIGRQAYINRKR